MGSDESTAGVSGAVVGGPSGETAGFTERTALLLGGQGLERLSASRRCVFGLGGVGAAAAVDLVRAGVGSIVACDFDEVGESNLNRLAFGYRRFLGVPKALAFAEVAREINPEAEVDARPLFITGERVAEAIPEGCDFYIDCIDSLNSKVNLIAVLSRAGLPFASSMGMGGRLDPSRIRMGSIWEASGCPLARSVRQRLRRFGLSQEYEVPCAWSDEPPAPPGLLRRPGAAYPVAPEEARAPPPSFRRPRATCSHPMRSEGFSTLAEASKKLF
jgi:tRNA threonylcarbamoyladenosine dehydratase